MGGEECHIENCPDKVLLLILGYLPHNILVHTASRVCKKWRSLSQDSRLWSFVSLRPEVSGITIPSIDFLVGLIRNRFGINLRYLELPCDLITVDVLNELAQRCPNLTHLLLDFSHGAQLADFSGLSAFPTKIRYLCFCLSETIFLDNFIKKILNFINGTQMLHLYGTYEQGEEEEGEVYEVLNIRSLKQATPNLVIINMWGVSFVDDAHIEAFSSNCIQLAVLCVSYCPKVGGVVTIQPTHYHLISGPRDESQDLAPEVQAPHLPPPSADRASGGACNSSRVGQGRGPSGTRHHRHGPEQPGDH